ncbi:hypothetical protein RR46_10303 [Papilio xuthus]|uniref:Replicase polyprotein 1a n=1 Tax=Papilio xuthus TaxID=66420 RepID=A0A194Q6F3_PAPXU|nr:hypothetical protein RR46_10303 [Papilio xuthus]
MLVAIIFQLIVATIASSYHKYPLVFLLDVGNEELTNTNTEQIRISIPGGSLAVRYPAISDGDLITHLRVSSIDFGSDLKASILDGGPGYKYVVLVFLGNPGVKCDAVITLQTLKQISSDPSIANWKVNSKSDSEINSEVMNNENKDLIKNKKNPDLTEESSNINDYAKYNDESDESEEIKDELDDVKGQIQDEDSNEDEINDIDDEIKESSNDSDESEDDDDHSERLSSYQSKYDNEVENTINAKSLDQDDKMYIQDSIYDAQGYNPDEDSIELDQIFNDEEVHNDADKFKDSNNNFDSEYGSAVA